METKNEENPITPEYLEYLKGMLEKGRWSEKDVFGAWDALPLLIAEVERLNKCLDDTFEFGGFHTDVMFTIRNMSVGAESGEFHPEMWEELKRRGL